MTRGVRQVFAQRYRNGRLKRAPVYDRALYQARLGYRWIKQMARYGIDREQAHDVRAGSELGRLRLAHAITERQYWIGDEYFALQLRHAAICGYTLGIFGRREGGALLPDPDPAVVAATKKRWRVCYEALQKAGREEALATYNVCVLDVPTDHIRALRRGLSALQKVLDK